MIKWLSLWLAASLAVLVAQCNGGLAAPSTPLPTPPGRCCVLALLTPTSSEIATFGRTRIAAASWPLDEWNSRGGVFEPAVASGGL
ncbi:MAG: hypothetical protein U0401_00910 [Anaerolineae bacterium]